MYILITNDDGYDAPGIKKLREMLLALGHDVTLAAPHRDNSAISHSISLGRPINIKEHGKQIYSLTGTPADCVMVALNADFIPRPELIISGINRGGNMGEDVHYSGTVAAAVEGAFNGIRSLAISAASRTDSEYGKIAPFLKEIIEKAAELEEKRFLNVNFDPAKELSGLEYTILGSRKYLDHFEFSGWDEKGKATAMLKPAENIPDMMEGTDFFAVASAKVSLTVISTDWTAGDEGKG